jgi:hypothetical protein
MVKIESSDSTEHRDLTHTHTHTHTHTGRRYTRGMKSVCDDNDNSISTVEGIKFIVAQLFKRSLLLRNKDVAITVFTESRH